MNNIAHNAILMGAKIQNIKTVTIRKMRFDQMLKWHLLRKYIDKTTVNVRIKKRIRSGPALTRRQRHLIPVATHNLGSIGIGTRTPLKVARKIALTDCRTHPAHR